MIRWSSGPVLSSEKKLLVDHWTRPSGWKFLISAKRPQRTEDRIPQKCGFLSNQLLAWFVWFKPGCVQNHFILVQILRVRPPFISRTITGICFSNGGSHWLLMPFVAWHLMSFALFYAWILEAVLDGISQRKSLISGLFGKTLVTNRVELCQDIFVCSLLWRNALCENLSKIRATQSPPPPRNNSAWRNAEGGTTACNTYHLRTPHHRASLMTSYWQFVCLFDRLTGNEFSSLSAEMRNCPRFTFPMFVEISREEMFCFVKEGFHLLLTETFLWDFSVGKPLRDVWKHLKTHCRRLLFLNNVYKACGSLLPCLKIKLKLA